MAVGDVNLTFTLPAQALPGRVVAVAGDGAATPTRGSGGAAQPQRPGAAGAAAAGDPKTAGPGTAGAASPGRPA